jgi:hypothetical protein
MAFIRQNRVLNLKSINRKGLGWLISLSLSGLFVDRKKIKNPVLQVAGAIKVILGTLQLSDLNINRKTGITKASRRMVTRIEF